jgi:hypothetical protein
MRELNMGQEVGRGMRVLVVSQFTEFDPADARCVESFDNIIAGAVEMLRQSKPIFDLRYGTVFEKQLPIQYCFSVCGEKGSGMRKVYRAWMKSINIKDFGICKEDREYFTFDGQFDDPVTGEQRMSAVLFMFDSRLPKTAKNTNNAQDAD